MDYEIVVLGFGAPCFTVCAYLNRELPNRVSRIVLTGKAEDMNDREIATLVEEKVKRNLGKNKVIAIYDLFLAMLVRNRLAAVFPMQRFAYPSIDILKSPGMSPAMDIRLRRCTAYQKARIRNDFETDRDRYKWCDRSKNGTLVERCILEGVKEALAGRDVSIVWDF
ncbi:hypothetical protein IKW75_03570 [Candidatus Saccharibacteria bacterium]|nr:hypothetical protein [Candidatus Saccharibacteria bacterium]